MGGLFDTLSIGKKGLSVSQTEINVSSHNIANTDTDGYSRQRANVSTSVPEGGNSKFDSIAVGQIGTGAEVTSIQRIRDSFIDKEVRSAQSNESYYDEQNTTLSSVSSYFDELDSSTGLKTDLSEFFNDFQELSTSTGDTSSNKTVAISAAETLASDLNSRYTELSNQQSGLQGDLKSDVTNVNELLEEIDGYNKQIENITAQGLTANDLMDKRDTALDSLSKELGISVSDGNNDGVSVTTTNANGSTSLTIASSADTTGATSTRFSYVDNVKYDSSSGTLTITYDKLGDSSNQGTITLSSVSSTDAETLESSLEKNRILVAGSDGTVSASSVSGVENAVFTQNTGKIAGNVATQTTIGGYIDQLNTFATTLAYSVNAIQTGSTTAASSDVPIFVASGTSSDDGINAENITLNSNLTTSNLNCDTSSSSGNDGARAKAIADLADLKIDYSSVLANSATRSSFFSSASTGLSFSSSDNCTLTSSTSTGSTLSDYYSNFVTDIDTDASKASKNLTTAESTLTTYEDDRTSNSGVSEDEEMTNLIEYQHVYQANAKVITTVSELLDTVIGLIS